MASTTPARPAVHAPSQPSNLAKDVNKIEDTVSSSDALKVAGAFYTANGAQVGSALQTIIDTTDMKTVENTVNGFAEASQVLMKALDAVQTIHPFIGVAVLALKLVISLELTRKSNDSKVIVLYAQMQDAASVLLQLRYIDPAKEGEADVLKDRLHAELAKLAERIKLCGNACDAYMRKHLAMRILKGPIYEGRLAEHAKAFAEHRQAIQYEISLCTKIGMDAANKSLTLLNQKVDVVLGDMITLFHRLDSTAEKEIKDYITSKGGADQCIESHEALGMIWNKCEKASAPSVSSSVSTTAPIPTDGKQRVTSVTLAAQAAGGARNDGETKATHQKLQLLELQKEYKQGWDEFVDANMGKFLGKLEMQQKQLEAHIEDIVKRQNELVIQAVNAGPYVRVLDPDLQILWKDMGWRSSVKARHFVLGVHDYFLEHAIRETSIAATTESDVHDLAHEWHATRSERRVPNDDQWALHYISAGRMLAIQEACDIDGAGFVSISEVNTFTTLKPKTWSLPHWLAYWAAGWHMKLDDYRSKITTLLRSIFALRPAILPVNQASVDDYLEGQWSTCVDWALQALKQPLAGPHDEILKEKTEPYALELEATLESNLATVGWDIDASNTLTLVAGTARIEHCFFPLVYVLLKRHVRLIRLAQRVAVNQAEFTDASRSMDIIVSAAYERVEEIERLARQQNKNASLELEVFSCGMFKLFGRDAKPDPKDSFVSWQEPDQAIIADDEKVDLSILRHGEADLYDTSAFGTDSHDAILDTGTGSIGVSGSWSSYDQTENEEWPIVGLTEIVFGECVGPEKTFEGTVENSRLGTATITDGRVSARDGVEDSEITFTWTFVSSEDEYVFRGTLDPNAAHVIEGKWGRDENTLEHEFRFSRAPAFAHRFRCNLVDHAHNPARARWVYACQAVLYAVRRRRCSWAFVRERLEERRKHVQLYKRKQQSVGGQSPCEWTDEHDADLTKLEDSLVQADRTLYRSIAEVERRKVTVHRVFCDTCRKNPLGHRVMCLICLLPDESNHVDLCLQCVGTTPKTDNFEHTQSHPVIRLSSTLLPLQKSWMISLAKFVEASSRSPEPATCNSCEKQIPQPYWFCLFCWLKDKTCILCEECNPSTVPKSCEDHTFDHPFVRLPAAASKDDTTAKVTENGNGSAIKEGGGLTEERLTRLEERIGRLEELLQKIVDKA